jgi:hypothetical protein
MGHPYCASTLLADAVQSRLHDVVRTSSRLGGSQAEVLSLGCRVAEDSAIGIGGGVIVGAVAMEHGRERIPSLRGELLPVF